jgi:hypothetical protein
MCQQIKQIYLEVSSFDVQWALPFPGKKNYVKTVTRE